MSDGVIASLNDALDKALDGAQEIKTAALSTTVEVPKDVGRAALAAARSLMDAAEAVFDAV